ncbi:glycosyltransferase [Shimia marina]|uniref:Glycosyl transferase family 2 n=1 Tax=Shimia marina TaxID=321267 RepID=A0A0P1EM84_9RHOB|nr:glycosyltransferase [Shimia marina]CUH51502.1 Glycosyl transferase family 2 [Shimia marina]SFD47542.1 Glycosyltransferase, GT2 family [Shimia marina]
MTDETHRLRLVAVVVTYNRLEQLKITIARLLESPAEHLSAIVVADNASNDGTQEWLETVSDPRVYIERLNKNGGGAGGFEAGMRRAMQDCDPDWLVVMDDDGRPRPGAFAAFHRLDLSKWDGIASAVFFPSGEICEMNRPSRNPFWHRAEFIRTLRGGRGGFHLRAEDYASDHGQPIDVTSFVGFFISRQAVEKIGYPDPDLFLYGDDGLYTLGLTNVGGRIGFEPSVQFEHDCSTFAGQRGRFRPLWKVYYYHRNLMLLYRLAAGWMFWPVLLIILPKWFLKIRAHGGERRIFLRLMWQAVKDGLRKHTNVEHDQVLRWASQK